MPKKPSHIRDNILYLMRRGYTSDQVRSYMLSHGFDSYYVDKEFFTIESKRIISYCFSLLFIIIASVLIISNAEPSVGYVVYSSEDAGFFTTLPIIIMAIFIALLILLVWNSHRH